MIVVTDNGALGHLVQIRRVELLPALHERVLIPPAVLRELAHPDTPPEIRFWSENLPDWTAVAAPAGAPDTSRPGAGEREAIRLALERGALLLCDAADAVKLARRQGLRVTGTLGILRQAHGRGWLLIEDEIAALRARTTMRLPEARLPDIIRTAHELRAETIALEGGP